MSENSRVAVLLSTYNGEKYIAHQIDSILAQKIDIPVKILVRDDGSTDSTLDILAEYENRFPAIKLYKGDNLGLTKSIFWILREAAEQKFTYYAFCDQDDEWLSDKLHSAISMMKHESADEPLLYGSCSILVDESLHETGSLTQCQHRPITFYNTSIQNICPAHNQVINHQLAEIVVAHFTDTKDIYSPDLWLANVAAVCGKIIFDNTPHTHYRQHSQNSLSYGSGLFGWIMQHIQRLRKQEGRRMSTQLRFFIQTYSDSLDKAQEDEIKLFFSAQEGILSRLNYVCHTKLFRQRSWETIFFKLLYLIGCYRPLLQVEGDHYCE